uniref:Uncharacterized protein n=1 Tax=Davidia involucrata TaxID=16924 RepID=A0A5B7ACC7_DAVIN
MTSVCLMSLAGYAHLTDLHSIGDLVPLLTYLKNTHADIQAKGAKVVTKIVQNNPRSQQLVMKANGLEPLLCNFTSDPDVTVCTKALCNGMMQRALVLFFQMQDDEVLWVCYEFNNALKIGQAYQLCILFVLFFL